MSVFVADLAAMARHPPKTDWPICRRACRKNRDAFIAKQTPLEKLIELYGHLQQRRISQNAQGPWRSSRHGSSAFLLFTAVAGDAGGRIYSFLRVPADQAAGLHRAAELQRARRATASSGRRSATPRNYAVLVLPLSLILALVGGRCC